MALFKRPDSEFWWYKFQFAGRPVRESAKTTSKTVAKAAEQQRRRELELGLNHLEDTRNDRIRTIREQAKSYLENYRLRNKSHPFAEYAVDHVTTHLGKRLLVDVSSDIVKAYQSSRLREGASPKTINEEVGFLFRILADHGDALRVKMKREKTLKLKVSKKVAKAYSASEKSALVAAAHAAPRSKAVHPATMLGLHAGLRDKEIRTIRWGQLDFKKDVLVVGETKTDAGTGRRIPMNSELRQTLDTYSRWYVKRFGAIRPEWYVFPFGKPRAKDPTRPQTTLKTAWRNVKTNAKVSGRFHDTRHTLITELAEPATGDEVIRDIAGHVSPAMLRDYSHIRMKAKREALEGLVKKSNKRGAKGRKKDAESD
jgi:integrase